MRENRTVALVTGVLLLILALHVSVAWQDLGTLARNGYLYDDSFYAFKIAQNIAAGNGATFDGIHPTSGFQPLYVFLLVPVYFLSSGDLSLPISVALTMLAVFTCLTALLVFRIARRYVGAAASLIAAAAWGLSPIVIRQSANGLETAVAAFMIAWSVWFYVDRVRPLERPPAKRLFQLGVLLGVTVLARIDAGLLVLVLLLDQLLLMRRRGGSVPIAARLLLIPAGVLLCYGPWLFYCFVESGSALQDSGSATRFLSLAYTSYFHQGPESLAMSGPDLSFIWKHIVHAASVLKVIPPVHVLFRAIERLGHMAGLQAVAGIVANLLGAAALIGAGVVVAGWKRHARRSKRRELDFLLLYAVLLAAAYATYIFGAFYFLRYFYPVYLVSCIYLAFVAQDCIDAAHLRRPALRRVLAAATAVYVALFLAFSFSQAFRSRPVYPFYDLARWVDEHTGEDETIGVFQCGTIGYLSGRTTINLDGKVNREAYAALREGRIDRYVRTAGIDVVIDHRRILEIFFGSKAGKPARACTPVAMEAPGQPCEWIAWRPPSPADLPGGGAAGGAAGNSDALVPID